MIFYDVLAAAFVGVFMALFGEYRYTRGFIDGVEAAGQVESIVDKYMPRKRAGSS